MARGNILGIKNMVAATNFVVDLFCRKFCKTCERKKHTGLMKFQSELWTSVGKMLKREDRWMSNGQKYETHQTTMFCFLFEFYVS